MGGEAADVRAVGVSQQHLTLIRLGISVDEGERFAVGRDSRATIYVVANLARRAAESGDLVERAEVGDLVVVIEIIAVAREAEPL